MAVSVNGNTNSTVYGKGDICLKLNPFDNFRMFTLYEDWRSDDRKPIDLSNGQKIYLVFKSKKKEIRIPEYDLVDSNYTVDKVNGQVLFKIAKKQAIDILAMDTKVFYITRVYDVTDSTGKKVVSSDEEVLYTGQWKDETSNTVENYTSQVKTLMTALDDRDAQIKSLQESNVKLMEQNADLAAQLAALQDSYDKMYVEYTAVESKLAEYQSGTEYTGTVIGTGTNYKIVTGVDSTTGKEYTEEQMANALKNLELDIQE